jgi:hypothetical protein
MSTEKLGLGGFSLRKKCSAIGRQATRLALYTDFSFSHALAVSGLAPPTQVSLPP